MKLMYKNIGTVTKEFYGVSFKPGDVKEVPGYINADSFIRVSHDEKCDNMQKNTANVPAPVTSAPKVEPVKSTSTKPDSSKDTQKDQPKDAVKDDSAETK